MHLHAKHAFSKNASLAYAKLTFSEIGYLIFKDQSMTRTTKIHHLCPTTPPCRLEVFRPRSCDLSCNRSHIVNFIVRPSCPPQTNKNMTMRFRPLFTIENKHFTNFIHFILRKACWLMNAAHTASSHIWGKSINGNIKKSVTFILCMIHHSKGSLRCI